MAMPKSWDLVIQMWVAGSSPARLVPVAQVGEQQQSQIYPLYTPHRHERDVRRAEAKRIFLKKLPPAYCATLQNAKP
jgi:hypothetical protein